MTIIKDINFKENNNWNQLLNLIYPIGSIYISVNSTSPGVLFGGTWSQLKDRFLLGANSTYTAGNTGGEATHILTPAETALKQHNHVLDHTHADTLSFSVAQHTSTNCTRSQNAAVSDHAATACSQTTNYAVSITNHTISTQPAFNYTPCASHSHSLTSGVGQMCNNSSYNFHYKGSTFSSWTSSWYIGTGTVGTSGSQSFTIGCGIQGSTSSVNHAGTANGTEVASSGAAVSAHSVTVTQPTLRTPKLTHSITQPTFTIPKFTHGTPTKSGSITNYSGSTGTITAANGSAHNNMPPYLVVYMWERTA